MKIRLEPQLTNYINNSIQLILASVLRKRDSEFPEFRALYKMRGKFAPNSLDIYLTKKERSLLVMMLNYRQQSLVKNGSISEEIDTIDAILNVLQTEAVK